MKTPTFEGTVLFVSDITKSKLFYEKVLNQQILYDLEGTVQFESGISIWQLQNEHILKETLKNDLKTNRFELYFETENIEEIEKNLRNHKVEFLHATLTELWGQKTLRFFDPDYHLIEIGESMHTFINRLHNEGDNLDQIHKRTMYPLNKIVQMLTEK